MRGVEDVVGVGVTLCGVVEDALVMRVGRLERRVRLKVVGAGIESVQRWRTSVDVRGQVHTESVG